MVEAKDPFFPNRKKYDADVKGTGLRYLLGQGANVNVYDLGGDTPLTYALERAEGSAILQMLVSKTYLSSYGFQ